jgi:rifampicin phosphotransferase
VNLLVFFDEPEAGLVSRVGGKGSNLIALTAAGFPVPPGFVITAEAYRLFLDRVDWLDAELGGLDYAHPDILREQCARLRARLGEVELPDPIRDAVFSGLVRVCGDGTSTDPFAVRSSSTFEDLAQAAFAGQHDTYLNIRGAKNIADRVRECILSLWADRAVLYRHHQGFSQREARMAVVVQRQIACDVAGVGFSIDPVSGRIDRMVIDANYGLGESVVAGECEVDHFELDKRTLEIVSRTVGHKDRMLAATPAGVEERAVLPALADQPCLSDEQMQAIAQLLKRVETHYGWPQDIEWGWKGDALYQFQSRPVTTIQPRWTRDESAERFPNPITPLTWEFIGVAFRGSMAHSLALMGLPPLQGDWFQTFDNFVYGNQNAVELIAQYRPLRARTVQELVGEIPDLRRRYAWVLDLPVNWARDLDRYLIRLGRLSAASLEGAQVPEVWAHMKESLAVASEYFRPNIAISMTQAFLHRLLHGLVGMAIGPERALGVVDGLLAGCETKTAVVNRELHELARLAAQTPALRAELLQGSTRQWLEQKRLQTFPEFAARLQKFLEDHGHREMDMDYYHPTWAAQPAIVLDALGLILRNDQAEDPAEVARRLRLRYAETEHEFLATVPEPLRFFFRELIRLARTYTALDDLEHYQTTRINPVARRRALALGSLLKERGILDEPDDVFFFHMADLEELVAAYPQEKRSAHRQLVYEAKRSYEESKRQPPPWSRDQVETAGEPPSGAVLRGLPGSPGKVTGKCFRVLVPEDFARFPKGAILVARTTNPAWTPLFYSAAGLITESGGPLSHGAVTAREMQLPAVMSVRGAMSRFRDGQIVTVDGTQGVVSVAEE